MTWNLFEWLTRVVVSPQTPPPPSSLPTPSLLRARIGFILLVCLAIALGLFLSRSYKAGKGGFAATENERDFAPRGAAKNGAQIEGVGQIPTGGAAIEEKTLVPPCWEGLMALDENPTLDELRAALLSAAAKGDPLLIEYLQARLAEVIADRSDAALTVIGWATQASPPLTGQLLEALKRAPAAQQRGVAEKLLQLGEDDNQGHDIRRAAIDALDSQKRLGAASIARLKTVALDEQSDEVGWVAARTIGRVMVEDYKHGGHFEGYWRELLDVGQRSSETAVRSLALEMPSYGDIPVDNDSIAKLTKILKQDPDRQVREMAAFRLGLSREPDKALQAFGEAFGGEKDLCVRWAIFRFAVRAAGEKALPLLQQLSSVEPQLRPDYEDFRKIYESGNVDFVRVWLSKPERHQCLEDAE